MSLNITIFVCLLANFLFSYRGYEAAPTKSLTIADSMKDAKICNSLLNIQHSHYLEECGKLNFPDKNDKITNENRNQFLCVALYDRYVKMCSYIDSLKEKKTEDLPVFNNQTVFDGAIEAILGKNDDKLWELCINLQNSSPPVYNKTISLVSQLQLELNYRPSCVLVCSIKYNENSVINPLCAALGIIDQKIKEKMSDVIELAKSPGNISQDSKMTKVADIKALDKNQTNSQNEIGHLTQLNSTVKNISNISNQSNSQINLHNDTSENKSMGGIKKILPDNGELSDPRIIPSKYEKPAISSPMQDTPIPVDKKKDGILSSPQPNSDENADIATSLIKPTTISEHTRDEQQGDEQSDYNMALTDNDRAIELDDGDDNQRPLPKDITQSDEDQLDEKEKTPRFPRIHTEDDSHFFGYITIIGLIGIGGCLLYHHKQKILAMMVEGRRSRGGRGRKRPSTASYRKLDCNLEEAVTSQCNSNVTHVIY